MKEKQTKEEVLQYIEVKLEDTYSRIAELINRMDERDELYEMKVNSILAMVDQIDIALEFIDKVVSAKNKAELMLVISEIVGAAKSQILIGEQMIYKLTDEFLHEDDCSGSS